MTSPRLSLVLPGKDVAPWIGDALSSLVDQLPVGELEVVVVDDGSTDQTSDVVASFADRLPRLVLHRNEEATGLASARNTGLGLATAPLIGFLDGDDWLARGHLARLVAAVEELDVDFVRCDHVRVTSGRRQLVRAPMAVRGRRLDPRDAILPTDDSSMVDYPYAWAGIFRRNLLEEGLLHFHDGLHTAEDRPWIWRLMLQGHSYAVVSSPGVMYRRGLSGSLTQIVDRRQLDFLRAYRLCFELLDADAGATRYEPKLVRQFLAVLASQMGRRGFPRELQAEMQREAVAILAGRDPEVLWSTGQAMDEKRRLRLQPVLRRVVPAGRRSAAPVAVTG